MKITICVLFILMFQIANVVDCIKSETQDESEDIDVDLKNIHDKDFDVIQAIIQIDPSYENKLESYKLTPRANKRIKNISFGKINVCDSNESLRCLNVTVYNSKHVYFIIKTLRDEENDYIYLRLFNKYFGLTGALQFLCDVNHESMEKRGIKALTLNVSNEFDKLYYKHMYLENDGYRYETFAPNENEVFSKVRDNIDTIWEFEASENNKGRCNEVRVFKEEKIIYNQSIGKRQVVMGYKFIVLGFERGTARRFELDDKLNKWVEIGSRKFSQETREYGKRGLNTLEMGETRVRPDDHSKIVTFNVFERHAWFAYEFDAIGDFRMVSLRNTSIFGIDQIRHNDHLLLDIGKREFYMNISMDGGGTVYLEIMFMLDADYFNKLISKGTMVEKIANNFYAIYYMRTPGRKQFIQISRSYYLRNVAESAASGDGRGDIKYANIYELEEGAAVEKLSREIKLRINPDYVERLDRPAIEPLSEDISHLFDYDRSVEPSPKEAPGRDDDRLRGHNSVDQAEPTDDALKQVEIAKKHHHRDEHDQEQDNVDKSPEIIATVPKTDIRQGPTDGESALDNKELEIEQDKPKDGLRTHHLGPNVLVDKTDHEIAPIGPKNDTGARDTSDLEKGSDEAKFSKTIEQLSRSAELIEKISKYSSVLNNITSFGKKKSGYLSNISVLAMTISLGLSLI